MSLGPGAASCQTRFLIHGWPLFYGGGCSRYSDTCKPATGVCRARLLVGHGVHDLLMEVLGIQRALP